MTDFVTGSILFNQINIIQYANRPFSDTDDMNGCILDNINSLVKDNDRLYIVGNFLFGPLADDKFIRTARWFRNKINCRNLFLLYGNHDRRAKKMDEFNRLFVKASDYMEIMMEDGASLRSAPLKGTNKSNFGAGVFEDKQGNSKHDLVHRPSNKTGNSEGISSSSQTVILMAYPIEEGQWNRANKGAWHFFSSTKDIKSEANSKRFNVGIDFVSKYLYGVGENTKTTREDLRKMYRPYSFEEIKRLATLGVF